ncbi:hypothetical protein GEV33_015231 [Tenebrio molitor]|uniref:Uncharacterized protein n=1 Tax=Tenebrio molitor TaxID=7067 RepID=A0A8J6H5A3_TENMO|nr:hypothetical protein GEV33_015232 [Tenebrio molitor]KAH0807561.1 hypothetical protein GEV33_015231 [Tenebrio molitor]
MFGPHVLCGRTAPEGRTVRGPEPPARPADGRRRGTYGPTFITVSPLRRSNLSDDNEESTTSSPTRFVSKSRLRCGSLKIQYVLQIVDGTRSKTRRENLEEIDLEELRIEKKSHVKLLQEKIDEKESILKVIEKDAVRPDRWSRTWWSKTSKDASMNMEIGKDEKSAGCKHPRPPCLD